MGVEGNAVILTCDFVDSVPSVNNVTFYDGDRSIPAALVITNNKVKCHSVKQYWILRSISMNTY